MNDTMHEQTKKDIANLERFLTFKLGNETYAFPVVVVKEVLESADLTHIPRTAPYMKGVFNLRGSVIPVIDIRLLFNMDKKGDKYPSSVIVADVMDNTGLTVFGILADHVDEVIELSRDNIESGDNLSHAEFVREIGKKDNQFILILDIHTIIKYVDKEIGQLAASD
jgi:purine-binding chemotaxis protein CheW